MPDCAIFADMGWEPRVVYDHPAWLRSPNVLVEVDRALRRGLRGIHGEVFLHRSATPLATVPLTDTEKTGQADLFLNACGGMRGV